MPHDERPDTEALIVAARPLREAYEQTRAERAALPAERLHPVNLDVQGAATTALGAYPAIAALIGRMREELPRTDVALIESIPTKADAANHAQSLHAGAATSLSEIQGLSESAAEARDLLYGELNQAIKRGALDPKRLKDFTRVLGFRAIARDLSLVVTVARDSWATLQHRTGLKEAELVRAEQIAARLWHVIGEREQSSARVAETTAERERAVTLLIADYEAARRAVAYLRWYEDDVDTIAPSLYGKRTRARSRRSSEDDEPADDNEPGAGGRPAGAGPGAGPATATPTPTPLAPSASAQPAAPGAPRMNPFTS